MQPGEDGNDRKVWMFPIRPVPDNDVKKPQMFVFKDMDDYENRGKNVDAEYTKMMAAAKKKRNKEACICCTDCSETRAKTADGNTDRYCRKTGET